MIDIFEKRMIVLLLLVGLDYVSTIELSALRANLTVCRTKACYDTAERILSYMNHSVDPCDDFYRFACGTFLETKTIPPGEVELSVYKKAEIKAELQLRTMMEAPPDNKDLKHELYVKQIYFLCMDEGQIDKLGITPILKMIQQLGGWPVLGERNSHVLAGVTWNPMKLEAEIGKMTFGQGSLLSISADVSPVGNSSVKPKLPVIAYPSFGVFGVGKVDITSILINGLNDTIVKEYFKYMVDIAVIVGADRARAEGQLKDSLSFMIELSKIIMSVEMDMNETFVIFSTQELIDHPKLGWLNWTNYFDGLHLPIIGGIPKTVMLWKSNYIAKLGPLLKNTPPKVVRNFMIWCAIQRVFPISDSRIIRRQYEFEAVVGGTLEVPLRWKKCVQDVSSLLMVATASMYVRKFVNHGVKDKINKMINRIAEEMLWTIQRSDWIRFWSKNLSKLKMLSMKRWIGYPDQLLDTYEMNKYYKNFSMNLDKYFEAVTDINRFNFNMMWSALNEKPTDIRKDWKQHVLGCSTIASYSHIQNSIDVSALFLQPPFFRQDVPDYVNFAALGNIIGHEITHAFDNRGRSFNYLGLMEDWWDEWSKKNFDNRTKCFIEQYGNFTESTTNLKLNGEVSLGENIADQGGLKIAFNTYSNSHQEEPALPGFEHMNNKQLFMLTLANIWCTKMRPESLVQSVTYSPHPPDEFRVTGMMMNLQEFGDLFSCPVGSRMNPKKKCPMW